MFVYIGELCRYLANQPEVPEEQGHKLRLAFGNGLRPDVWEKAGGPLRGAPRARVLRLDRGQRLDVQLRRQAGRDRPRAGLSERLLQHPPGQVRRRDRGAGTRPGRPVHRSGDRRGRRMPGRDQAGRPHAYVGYADKAASEKKVLRGAFRTGDAWFRTGDLLRKDADGYFYFVDRIGDTFRWKGENVSTSEVAGALAQAPGVKEANVYGVKVGDLDGRAGMAGLVVDAAFDPKTFGAFRRPAVAGLRPAGVPAHPARHRDHRHLQVPQARPRRRRVRSRRGQGPALCPRREGLPEADPALLAKVLSGEARV